MSLQTATTAPTAADSFGISRRAAARAARVIPTIPVYHVLNALGAYKAFRDGTTKLRPFVHDDRGRRIAPVCSVTSCHLMAKIGLEYLDQVTPFLSPGQHRKLKRRKLECHRREAERRVEAALAAREAQSAVPSTPEPPSETNATNSGAPRGDRLDFIVRTYGGIDVRSKSFDHGARVVVVVFMEGETAPTKTRRVFSLFNGAAFRQKSGGAAVMSIEKMRETDWRLSQLCDFPVALMAIANDI